MERKHGRVAPGGRIAVPLPAAWRWIPALLLAVTAAPAIGMVRTVDPGEMPKLGPDEGLLLVEVDSNSPLGSIRVKKDGALFTAGVMRYPDKGRTARLYVVPAGRYAWHDVNLSWFASYVLKDKDEYHFDVVPGKITYGGDLVIRLTGMWSADIVVVNRGLQAMDWLEAQHPQLARDYEFVYAGHYPDPFPAFYRKERASSTAGTAELSTVAQPPSPSELPLSIRDLWKPDRIDWVSLNPAGDLLVEAVRESNGRWALDLIDLGNDRATRLAESALPFVALDWASDRLLLAGIGEPGGEQIITVFRMGQAPGTSGIVSQRLRASGHVLATGYGAPNRVLFQANVDGRRVLVQELDLSTPESTDSFRPIMRQRLNVGVDHDLAWYADGRGILRAAIARSGDGRIVLMHGDGQTFHEVLDLGEEGGFDPQGLSADGNLFYGLTDEGRAQRDLVEFDPVQHKVTRTIFSKPGVDVVHGVLDDHHALIGAMYLENGRYVTDYFDAPRRQLAKVVENAFRGKIVSVADRSRDGQHLLLWVQGSDQPPILYHLDVARGRAVQLDAAEPWLDGKHFAPSEVVHATSRDGLPVEAYLTMPPGNTRHPLVVLPHGGPVGVVDTLVFNPEVQFLASLGYAVLQVNYRGSDGYGKAFRKAGYQQWGTGIEDDIDAALQAALSRYPLDAQRMCVMGASYGGYSALESALRWPDRFRCVISMAGVSDRVLLFSASDFGQRARLRDEAERVIGNPRVDLEQMLATSPLYHYRDLVAPVMLVHGSEDLRVDYEHSRRLVRMLNLAGHKPVMLSFDQEAHGLEQLDDIEKAYTGIAGFLAEYLGPAPPVPAGKAAPAAAAARAR